MVADRIMTSLGFLHLVVAKCGDISEELTTSIFRATWLKMRLCTEDDLRFHRNC